MNRDEMIQAILDCTIFHGGECTSGYQITTEQAEKIYRLFLFAPDRKEQRIMPKSTVSDKGLLSTSAKSNWICTYCGKISERPMIHDFCPGSFIQVDS